MSIRKAAFLGTYAPRQCGIATFTTHLSEAIAAAAPDVRCIALALNEPRLRHTYPPRVELEIEQGDLASYRRAADFLNASAVDVLSVQHEYGIFGGSAGSHLLEILSGLRVPVVTTLHTLLAEPSPAQRAVLDEVIGLSERLVVMSQHGARVLRDVHGVEDAKIDLIPHGIPDVPPSAQCKSELGVEGRSMILTFGLLSPGKGIESVIEAMPAILERCPDALYVVLGATHPRVREEQGETYRLGLEARAQELCVDASVVLYDRFVSEAELGRFLSAADVYVTPYLTAEQTTSGTLAYAVGSGKAVVSTPYSYARELLAEGRGILVPWRDPGALAQAVIEVLHDDGKRLALQERSAIYGRDMRWPVVAGRYVESFERARAQRAGRRTEAAPKPLAKRPVELPPVHLEHLRTLTDSTGILQHATFDVPRYEDGYCLDDNARALLLTALLDEAGTEDPQVVRALATRYLAFVSHSFNKDAGRFRNFLSFPRRFTEDCGSEDCHARACWALGAIASRTAAPGPRALAGELFRAALPAVSSFTSPRAWAYVSLGIDEYLQGNAGLAPVEAMRAGLAEKLLDVFRRASRPDWPWFEETATYANARLPQALLTSGAALENEAMIAAGLTSLEWLWRVQCASDGCFEPIGSDGFYRRGGVKAKFDQQPVEACAMISACLVAERVTTDPSWRLRARRVFGWFLGHNHLRRALYDPVSGGCRDGLHADRLNENQGAESTISFLLALSEMRAVDRARRAGASTPRRRTRSFSGDSRVLATALPSTSRRLPETTRAVTSRSVD